MNNLDKIAHIKGYSWKEDPRPLGYNGMHYLIGMQKLLTDKMTPK